MLDWGWVGGWRWLAAACNTGTLGHVLPLLCTPLCSARPNPFPPALPSPRRLTVLFVFPTFMGALKVLKSVITFKRGAIADKEVGRRVSGFGAVA